MKIGRHDITPTLLAFAIVTAMKDLGVDSRAYCQKTIAERLQWADNNAAAVFDVLDHLERENGDIFVVMDVRELARRKNRPSCA